MTNSSMDTLRAQPSEWRNIALLTGSQILYLIATITAMTLSGLVGLNLAPDPRLATLPIAMLQVGALITTFPASMLMKRVGRRSGFLVGAIGGGAGGGGLASLGIINEQFVLFCLGNLLLGSYQAFAMYYRFAAADCASDSFRSMAISLVMAGGVVAAFLGPWNANLGQQLWSAAPTAGPYLVILASSLVAMVLLSQLQIPTPKPDVQSGHERPLWEICRQPAFVVALLAAAMGYALMIMLMTATPLAMGAAGYDMQQIARVMQWHVLGMFAPSFVTGWLIARFGVLNILLAGGLLLGGASALAASGSAYAVFFTALALLGVGWNFLFVGGSSLLVQTHQPAERGKVQGLNDLLIFTLVVAGALLAGVLQAVIGWRGLNLLALPLVLLTLLPTIWLRNFRPSGIP